MYWHIVAALFCIVASACSPNDGRNGTATLPPTPSSLPALQPAVVATQTVMTELADVFAGLLTELQLHPEKDVVEDFALGNGWKEAPTAMIEMANAKRGFYGKLAGQTVLLGTDGSNDLFSMFISENFEPVEFLNHLRGVVTMKPGTSESSLGQKSDVYQIADGNELLGVMFLTYGVADAIKGTGSISFITDDRARKEQAVP